MNQIELKPRTLNAQLSTLNVQRKDSKFDLEERLMDFAVRVIRVTETMHRTPAGGYVSDQLLRSGSSPYGHHGEAEGAESRDDFIHKLRVCYKELRETRRWLRLTQRVPLVPKPELLVDLLAESDELVRIFSKSIQTAEKNRPVKSGRNAQRSTFNTQLSMGARSPIEATEKRGLT